MVVEVTNPANSNMHYGDKPAVGVISAPDKLPNRVLYTNAQANREYNDIQYDIYQTQKEHDRLIKKPKSKKGWFVALGIIALITTAIIFRKKFGALCKSVFGKIKNVFKKH